MTEADLKERTKRFAHRCLDVVEALPKGIASDILGRQIGRSATSVAANYRAACRGRSKAEFAAKLGTVEEEADESGFWLTMIAERNLLPKTKLAHLIQESPVLTANMVSSIRSSRNPIQNPQSKIQNP